MTFRRVLFLRRGSSRSAGPLFWRAPSSCSAVRNKRRRGETFYLPAIMSIRACLRRSKALFAPALLRPASQPIAGFRRSPSSREWPRSARINPGNSTRTTPRSSMNEISTREVAMLRRRVDATRLDEAITRASESLVALQHPDGHWVFELEADVTIPSEFILLQHYFGRIEPELQTRIAKYTRATQRADRGWPLFHGGALDLSASVKAYFALKASGDPVDAPHMERARSAILARGGARHCNVFTRILLALFGELPCRAVPVMPVEIMLLPSWFPFHIDKISYWSRTVLVPLLVLMALRPTSRNPRGVTIAELFVEPPESA